jgi:nitroreductase
MNSSHNIDNFLELVSRRSSCRAYRDEPIPTEMIRKCLEAARLAPSACNKQPWRFVVVTDPSLRRRLCDEGLLPGLPMPWLRQAPVIVALCAETSFVTHKFAPMLSGVDYRLVDLGIAGEHFVLAAEAQGLGTCWIGWFREKPVRRILGIPRRCRVFSLLSVGFPEQESEPASRFDLEQLAYSEQWGQELDK